MYVILSFSVKMTDKSLNEILWYTQGCTQMGELGVQPPSLQKLVLSMAMSIVLVL